MSHDIDRLGLSTRVRNNLLRRGIRTVAQLRSMSQDDLDVLYLLGPKGFAEIRARLAEAEPPVPPVQLADQIRAAQTVSLARLEADTVLAPDLLTLHTCVVRLVDLLIQMNERLTALELRQRGADAGR